MTDCINELDVRRIIAELGSDVDPSIGLFGTGAKLTIRRVSSPRGIARIQARVLRSAL